MKNYLIDYYKYATDFSYYNDQISILESDQNYIEYKSKVISTIEKLSDNYDYFLADGYHKNSYLGKVDPIDSNYIIPYRFKKSELIDNLFVFKDSNWDYFFAKSLDDTPYTDSDILTNNYPKFIHYNSIRFTCGYGIITNDTNLIVLDIDFGTQLNSISNIDPNILNYCKFKRIDKSTDRCSIHLYFKKPTSLYSQLNSSNIRRIIIGDVKIWISGTSANGIQSNIDTLHMFNGINYNHELVGDMNDIPECPQWLIDKIFE